MSRFALRRELEAIFADGEAHTLEECVKLATVIEDDTAVGSAERQRANGVNSADYRLHEISRERLVEIGKRLLVRDTLEAMRRRGELQRIETGTYRRE